MRVAFGGSVGVDCGSDDFVNVVRGGHGVGVEISFGSVDVRDPEWTGA